MIRGYTEDSLKERTAVHPGIVLDVSLPVWRTGKVLYFSLPVWRTGEVRYFAARLLAEFQDVQVVMINCRFTGLFGRTITSLHWRRLTRSRPCRQDEVETTTNVTVPQLKENIVEIIHQLLSPLYEAFDFYTLSRTLVEEELSSLRQNRF